ncbi:alpha/beta hydrolase [Nocardioides sp. ChNu-153]|uniref:alpha/beta hydrolase n=1 Tax=Nocardioides sp. ChNu-153 TaxID=2779364 RepID=UPI0026599210|nr:alpha/beta hydrolase [Nocardioides sp. ChNu-153]
MSWQMRAVGALMRATRKRRFTDPDGGAALLARPKGDPTPPARLTRRLLATSETLDGFQVHTLRRYGAPRGTRPVVVYLHGGAYISEIVRQHWDVVAGLVDALDVEVQVPIYGLAPQHTAAEARSLVATVLDRLREQGRPAYLVGDSAGGGLALVAAQQEAARRGEDSPVVGLTLLAPWLDLSMANPGIDAVEAVDPWLARAALREVARVWADGTPLDDALVSPLFGDVAGLPPVDLWVGTRDVTQPDCRLLARRVQDAGGVVRYHEVAGAIHVFPLLPVPEGRAALREIHAHLRSVLG